MSPKISSLAKMLLFFILLTTARMSLDTGSLHNDQLRNLLLCCSSIHKWIPPARYTVICWVSGRTRVHPTGTFSFLAKHTHKTSNSWSRRGKIRWSSPPSTANTLHAIPHPGKELLHSVYYIIRTLLYYTSISFPGGGRRRVEEER